MHCVTISVQQLSARDGDGQVAQLHLSLAALSALSAPGIPVTELAGQVCRGKRAGRSAADLGNRAQPAGQAVWHRPGIKPLAREGHGQNMTVATRPTAERKTSRPLS